MTHRTESRVYRFLDLRVGIESVRPETLALLDAVYGHLRQGDRDVASSDVVAKLANGASDGGYRLKIGNRVHDLAAPPLTDTHAHSILFGEFLDLLDGFFFIHGAALTDGARTLVLSGPTGRGKTTLSLELMGRGFRLLSDDFAPLSRQDGLIHPFPKRVGVKRRSPDERADALPEPLRRARPMPMGDKWLLDPRQLPGVLESRPKLPTHVLLLDPSAAADEPDRTDRFRVGLVHGTEAFAAELRRVGASLRPASSPGGRPALDVEIRGGAARLREFYEVCARHRHQILCFDDFRSPLEFAGEPAIEPLGSFESWTSLLREVLNRGGDSRLRRSVGGGFAPLVVELGALLRDVAAARLSPGPPAATAQHVADWVRRGSP